MPTPTPDFSFGIIPVFKQDSDFMYLIVQHRGLHWSFPKGHKEGNETDLEAAKRELWEETGIIDIQIVADKTYSYSHVFESPKGIFHKTNTMYLGWMPDMNYSIPEEWKHEILDAKWCTYEEAKVLINFDPINEMLIEVDRYVASVI